MSIRCLYSLVIMASLILAGPALAKKDSKDGNASIKEISGAMAEMWCSKLEECASNSEMGPKECRKVLKKSFRDGFKNVPNGQEVAVQKTTLEQCSESIKKDNCDALKKAQTLPGCEFISLLNRY